MLKKQFFTQDGQLIIEAIIALSALLVLIAAIAVVITVSLSNATFSNNQDLANKHAQEGIEIIRDLARSNSNIPLGSGATVFTIDGNAFCMDSEGNITAGTGGSVPRDGCGVNLADTFVRTVAFDRDFCGGAPFQGTEVAVQVAWSSGKCTCTNVATCTIAQRYCHQAELVSCFKRPQSSITP